MAIELTPEHERLIEHVIHSGAYRDAKDVISASLEALAGHVLEPRVSLSPSAGLRFDNCATSLVRDGPRC